MHGPGSVSSSPFQHSETYYRAISARNQGPISATEFSGFYVLRLSEPPYDYLLRPIDLLVDLPTRANESIDEKDRDEQGRDAKEFAEPSAINGGPDHRDEKKQRQERRRGRHKHHTSSQADGGFGSGGANSSFFPRMRRSAQAIGS